MKTYGITLFFSEMLQKDKNTLQTFEINILVNSHKTVKIYNPEFDHEHLHPDLRSRLQL